MRFILSLRGGVGKRKGSEAEQRRVGNGDGLYHLFINKQKLG